VTYFTTLKMNLKLTDVKHDNNITTVAMIATTMSVVNEDTRNKQKGDHENTSRVVARRSARSRVAHQVGGIQKIN